MPKPKYTPLDYTSEDTEISDAVAFVMAAQALDVAAMDAIQCHDRETLVSVAALWLKMAEDLSGGVEDSEPEVHEPTPVGFRKVEVELENDEHTED